MKKIIKDVIKKNPIIWRLYEYFREHFFMLCTIISPTLNFKMRYFYVFGRIPNLSHPNNFIEKLNWIKLNKINKEEIYRQCADKYMVRDYVEKSGCSEILNELIAVYDRIEDVDWDSLPKSFALKMTDGCGCNVICRDKSKLSIAETINSFKKWEHNKEYLRYGELQNKPYYRRIIIEKYLGNSEKDELPADYKFYCFNGKVAAILVIWNRDTNDKQGVFMSPDWEYISRPNKYETIDNKLPAKPKCLDEMVMCAERLARPFLFVRVDLYEVNEKVIFGELTFTCAGSINTSETPIEVMDMGKLLKIPTDPEFNYTEKA